MVSSVDFPLNPSMLTHQEMLPLGLTMSELLFPPFRITRGDSIGAEWDIFPYIFHELIHDYP